MTTQAPSTEPTVVSTPLQTWITYPTLESMPEWLQKRMHTKSYRLVYWPGGVGMPHVVHYLVAPTP